jgi:hypothetical protein
MKKVTIVLAVLVAILVMSSCVSGSSSGGGWMNSVAWGEKATLGFSVYCDFPDALGEVQYNDHGAGVQFHSSAQLPVSWKDDDTVCFIDSWTGFGCLEAPYRPQPKGEPGILKLCVDDGGATGPDKMDWVTVNLYGGAFDGYSNCGWLQGGNITTD